jgi:hypothetical protein
VTSHRWVLPALGAVICSMLAGLGPAPSAMAAPPDPTTPLGLPAGVTASVSGSAAVTNKSFDDFPSQGPTYYVLSTGNAPSAFPAAPDPDAQLSTDRGDDGAPDSSTLTLTVDDAVAAGCLFVDFALATEEPVHKYTENVPGDRLTIRKDGVDYATNAGRGYFQQATWLAEPKPYQVNAINYWHEPGDPTDPEPGTAEEPWLPEATALNAVTTRDTARIPLDLTEGPETIEIEVADANNGDLDSVALLDDVRLGRSCGNGSGVEPEPVHDGGVIAGIRGVGNALVYDPIPSTDAIERYDQAVNGWRSPSGVPVELRFRWYRTLPTYALDGNMSHWVPIPDADRQSYVPTAGDKNMVLIVLVTGVVDGRRYETYPSTGESGTWYVTTPIADGTFVEGEAANITGPSDGTAAAGDVLTAQIGHTVPREDTWTWRWYADNVLISGATGQSLTLSAAQAGKVITVQATARRASFTDKTWTSAPYGPIQLQTWTETGTPKIVVDGVAEYGKTLTASAGNWVPVPDRYAYQWKRNGSVISGATFANYTIRADDVGARISVVVTGSKAGYVPVPKESAEVTVLGATMAGAVPVISGTPQVGRQLTGSVTDWDPNGSTLTYAWYVGGTLAQEGSANFIVPAGAVGKAIVLKVTGRKAGYTPRTMESAPTSPVVAGVLTAERPTIRGFARVGDTLIASAGYWAPTGVRLAYRWKIGTNVVTGPRGGQQTFVIPRTARGKRISVMVTGTLTGYTTVKKTSAPTARVVR